MSDASETLSSFKDGVQVAWDATSIHLAETCLRKYYYRMEGWTRPEKSVHLLFGSWYATALEHYYKHLALGMSSHEALREVVRETLVATWQAEGHRRLEDGTLSAEPEPLFLDQILPRDLPWYSETGRPWTTDHPAKTRENLIRTIIWYVDQFEDEAIHVVTLSNGKPAVELSFSLEVEDLIFCGHMDRVVQYSGDYYVMDQKTTGTTINSRYFDKFNPNMQMSMYTFAGKIIYDLPVKGVIIDAVQIAVGFSKFSRGFTFRTGPQLDEWLQDALHHIRVAQEATMENHFPMNTASCDLYGGCEFRGICSRSPQVRKNFLKGEFVKGERWEPLKRR